MEIRLIIAQYRNRYPGEHAPNVVDAWDEYTLMDNWEGYNEALRKHQEMVPSEYEAVRELTITVPDIAVDSLFEIPIVDAEVADAS